MREDPSRPRPDGVPAASGPAGPSGRFPWLITDLVTGPGDAAGGLGYTVDGLDYCVRPMTGAATTKLYRCPGCDHHIALGTPHVVVWPAGQLADRRHWHSPCWARQRRLKGGLKVPRPKGRR